MAVLAVYIFAVIPMAVVAQTTIAPVVIEGNGAGRCPSLEQVKSHRRLLTDRVLSVLSPNKYLNVEQCGDGVWYKAFSVNMSDANSQCPSGWVEESAGGLRTCGRGTVGASCRSVYISSDNREYTKICGRAIGYQYGHTDAFAVSARGSIDQVYVDGLSITYGSPRQHVWTYASAVREGPSSYVGSNCPCSSYPGAQPPSFLGNNWYCESGNPNPITPTDVLSNDPLWDGRDCEGTCCSNGKSPPWFSVDLPRSTIENIEARICASEHSDTNEDVFIAIFEIYIQ